MGKSAKKTKQSAQRKNERLNQVVLEEDDILFGRVLKKFGDGHFHIQAPNTDGHMVEVNAKLLGKSTVYPSPGDVIVVGRNESGKHITYEVLGVCSKKVVDQLRKDKRLHPSLFSDEDSLLGDIFDYSEEDKKEDNKEGVVVVKKDKANKPVKKEKQIVENDISDDDVDVDNI